MNVKNAAHLSGFEGPLMIDYLERQEVFEREEVRRDDTAKARRKGRVRDYSFRDVVILRAIYQLLGKGVSVSKIKKAVIALSRDEKFRCDRERILHDQSPIQYLVSDGEQIYFRKNGAELISLLDNGQQAFTFLIDMTVTHREVRAREPGKRARLVKAAGS